MQDPVTPAFFFFYIFIAFAYLVGAIALIIWNLILKPLIIYLSDKNYQKSVIAQNFFYDESKILATLD